MSREIPPPKVLATALSRRSKHSSRKGRQESPRKDLSQGLLNGLNLIINTGNSGGLKYALAQPEQLRSSPPFYEGSETENLREYLNWLIAKGHISVAHGGSAKLALSRAGWGFQQVRLIEKSEWEEMGIPRGVVVIILMKQKEWSQVSMRLHIAEETARRMREEVVEGEEVDIDELVEE